MLIVDDQMMVREGFSVLLDAQPDIEVVGEAVDGREAVAKVAALRPDVVLMDVRMPELNGIEATRGITATAGRPPADRRTKVLVLTTFDLDEYVYAGAARRRERVPAQGRLRPATGRRRYGWWPPARRCSRRRSPAG